jgi:hypothetical protein
MSELCKCKGCGQGIIWAKTTANKNVPLDPKVEQRFMVLNKGEPYMVALVPTYQTHFATCPASATFRKSARRADG